jgi:hypothetical protein
MDSLKPRDSTYHWRPLVTSPDSPPCPFLFLFLFPAARTLEGRGRGLEAVRISEGDGEWRWWMMVKEARRGAHSLGAGG